MYGYIYKTTNLIDNKIYIGKKKGEFTEKYKGSGKYLRNAVNKYGVENFKVEIIEYCETLEEQNEKEKYWIDYYRNQNVEMYNISDGGDGGNTFAELDDIDRQKRIQKLKENSYFANLTPEQDKEIRRKSWETRRKNGKDKLTPEQSLKLSNSLKQYYSSEEYQLKLAKQREINKQIKLKKKQQFMQQWLLEEHYCKTCGKRITKYIGKGLYCSQSCAATHPHTEETKKLISEMNRNGICGNKGKHLSEESKQNHSKAMIGKNKGKIWITNGFECKSIFPNELDIYISLGYKRGRKIIGKDYTPWNKGLKATEDKRVANNIKNLVSYNKNKGENKNG